MPARSAELAMAFVAASPAQILHVRISTRRALHVLGGSLCQQHSVVEAGPVAPQREAMLTTTLSGEPGTLRRFAEAAVAGTRLNITELRHRCAVAPCSIPWHNIMICEARSCIHLTQRRTCWAPCRIMYLSSNSLAGSCTIGACQYVNMAGLYWLACRTAHSLCLPGTSRAGRAMSCGAWACTSLLICQTSWRAWTRRASPRATSPPSRPPRRAHNPGVKTLIPGLTSPLGIRAAEVPVRPALMSRTEMSESGYAYP